MSSFKDFLRAYNIKDVVPTLEAIQKTIDFHHKDIDMLKLVYQTWPTFVCIILLMQNSMLSLREIKTFWKKIEKLLLAVHLLCLHDKQ